MIHTCGRKGSGRIGSFPKKTRQGRTTNHLHGKFTSPQRLRHRRDQQQTFTFIRDEQRCSCTQTIQTEIQQLYHGSNQEANVKRRELLHDTQPPPPGKQVNNPTTTTMVAAILLQKKRLVSIIDQACGGGIAAPAAEETSTVRTGSQQHQQPQGLLLPQMTSPTKRRRTDSGRPSKTVRFADTPAQERTFNIYQDCQTEEDRQKVREIVWYTVRSFLGSLCGS